MTWQPAWTGPRTRAMGSWAGIGEFQAGVPWREWVRSVIEHLSAVQTSCSAWGESRWSALPLDVLRAPLGHVPEEIDRGDLGNAGIVAPIDLVHGDNDSL